MPFFNNFAEFLENNQTSNFPKNLRFNFKLKIAFTISILSENKSTVLKSLHFNFVKNPSKHQKLRKLGHFDWWDFYLGFFRDFFMTTSSSSSESFTNAFLIRFRGILCQFHQIIWKTTKFDELLFLIWRM